MFRDRLAWAAIIGVLVVGCNFQLTAATDGGGDDGVPLPTVGFTQTMSTQDEGSGTVMVTVQLSEPAAGPVSVDVTFSGDADLGSDYTATPGTLSFGAGEMTKTVDLSIVKDTVPEGDEVIVIELGGASGLRIGTDTHRLTISMNELPRVSLVGSNGTIGDEDVAQTVTFMLTEAANGPATVDYTITGITAKATGPYADFASVSGQIMFPQGNVMQTLPLQIITDARNEISETMMITLTTSTGVVIDTMADEQVHIINNDDLPPTVRFSGAGSTTNFPEGDSGTGQAMINVTLNAESGRTVVVPFTITSATATTPADYTVTGSSVTFPEGVTTVALVVDVVGDMTDEPDEEVNFAIQAPADGSAILGNQPSRRLMINDDDQWCNGSGAFRVCYASAPTTDVVLAATINTTSGGPCAMQPMGWSGQGQPGACFILGRNITMSQATVVTGSRPLVLVAAADITISQTLDAAAHTSNVGPAPGAPFASCPMFLATPGGTGGAGGGAGATFMTQGGNGGTGDGGTSNPGGIAPGASPAPSILRAGCTGQVGGASGNTPGIAGAGGGVVYLLAGGKITITGTINVSGSAGRGGGNFTGGSGAGSGGMIMIDAATLDVGGAILMANGGGGSSGGDSSLGGNDGSDPDPANPLAAAAGGASGGAGATGGVGFAGPTAAAPGGTGGNGKGGGGGGGGGGYIKSSAPLTGAMFSAGLVQAP